MTYELPFDDAYEPYHASSPTDRVILTTPTSPTTHPRRPTASSSNCRCTAIARIRTSLILGHFPMTK